MPEPAELEPGAGADPATGTMVFRLTRAQGRRRRLGHLGGAAILWMLGLVRYVVAGRLSADRGVLPLVLLAAVLALGAMLLSGMAPVVVASDDVLAARYGPRRATVARTDISDIEIRERGVGRRVVVHHAGRRTVLPVPLTGGSLLGPGPDPALDHKVELLRGWWRRPSPS